MAAVETPDAWVGKQVVVKLVPLPGTSPDESSVSREGQLQGISDWGITVLSTYDSEVAGEYQRSEFYPWTAVRSMWPTDELRAGSPPPA
jgi:hypothetical protein